MIEGLPAVHMHVFLVGACLLALLGYFIAGFIVPAHRVRRRLDVALTRLADGPVAEGADLSFVFAGEKEFAHPWNEFRETLHEVRVVNPHSGLEEVSTLRATVPAEMFFTDDVLVDHHIKTEFFKHLPGIFTGIGIIGTFTGLLFGLSQFGVSANPDQARKSLEVLLSAVSEAFVVSAAAILLAMAVTFVEKQILVGLYARARALTQRIDESFKAGVGEEYLARLVGASEQSATHSAHLKDALVGDLRKILVEISERQIASFSASQMQLGENICESVSTALARPLEKLALATESVRGDQGQAVQQLMADLLAQFSTKLESLFGGQIAGIQQMQQQSIEGLKEAVGQLSNMLATVEGAGQRATETLMERLEETLRKLDQRQLVMGEEMRKFVQEIRNLVGESQSESHKRLESLLGQLASHTESSVGVLTRSSEAAVGAMGSQVEGLSERVGDAVTQMAAAVGRLEAVTTSAITGMNDGAATLAIAADDFAKAGGGVSGALLKAQTIAGELVQASSALTAGSSALGGLLADYRSTRDAVAQMLAVVSATVESARREASLTEDVVKRIEMSATKLAAAHGEADVYLESVTKVLEEAHREFASAITTTLGAGHSQFHNAVSQTTKLLSDTLQELESVLGDAPRAAASLRR